MIAVWKHELKLYFRSLTAYVFGAFLLLCIGFGAMLYNIQAAVSNFEFVLSFASFIFVIIVPILTMRVIAEEKKLKTDQLLYSLPITTTEVILGKYLALLAVYLIPLLIICIYPLIFAQFGEVYLLTAYGSILAFFLMGSAFLALGIFISSLTENQGFAAGIGIAVILLNFFSVSLSEYVSKNAIGSMIALGLIAIAFGQLVSHLTKHENLGFAITIVLVAVIAGVYFLNAEMFEGLLPAIMKQLSLFDRFEGFVNGIFDMTAVTYYVTFAIFFLYLSVQSMEKRRYN